MQCRQANLEISAYIDKELDARSAAELELHLRQCASCRERLEQLRRTDAALLHMPRIELGADFAQRVLMLAGEHGSPGKLPEEMSQPPGVSQLLDGFRELFGIQKNTVPDALEEFDDFFPLSISSTYFSIIGETER